MDTKSRTTIQIPDYHWRRGKIWAWLKGRGIATLVSDVFQARVEANEDEIQRMLTNRAKDLGITPDELMDQILQTELDEPVE